LQVQVLSPLLLEALLARGFRFLGRRRYPSEQKLDSGESVMNNVYAALRLDDDGFVRSDSLVP
jgi:hypothetical protein